MAAAAFATLFGLTVEAYQRDSSRPLLHPHASAAAEDIAKDATGSLAEQEEEGSGFESEPHLLPPPPPSMPPLPLPSACTSSYENDSPVELCKSWCGTTVHHTDGCDRCDCKACGPDICAPPLPSPPPPSTDNVIASIGCMQPSNFIFWHVMKTGGLALDDMLQCACTAGPLTCAVWHREGTNVIAGDHECELHPGPTVLTTHGTPSSLDLHDKQRKARITDRHKTLKTASWAHASNITILRHPVKRVWSYYAYGNEKNYKPFKEHPLEFFLSQPQHDITRELFPTESLDDDDDDEADESFNVKPFQLYNRMTRTFGQEGNECGGPTFGEPLCHSFHNHEHTMVRANQTRSPDELREIEQRWLARALQRLRAFDYIGFTERFDEIEDDLRLVWPSLLKSQPGATTVCKLGVENPTDYDGIGLPHEPPDGVRKLIEERNALDMILYTKALQIAKEKRDALYQRSNTPIPIHDIGGKRGFTGGAYNFHDGEK